MSQAGKYVKGRFGSDFNLSLTNDDITLMPGNYMVMIDPLWNDSANLSGKFKEILVDIYASENVMIDQVDDQAGYECFGKALKHHAQTFSSENAREHYLADNPDFGKDVMRIQDIKSLPCGYGYIYTKNSSDKGLHETLSPVLNGFSVIFPIEPNASDDSERSASDIEIKVPAGEDHIVILRKEQENCDF